MAVGLDAEDAILLDIFLEGVLCGISQSFCQCEEVMLAYQCLYAAEEHVLVKVISLDVGDAQAPRGGGHGDRVRGDRLLALAAGITAVDDHWASII